MLMLNMNRILATLLVISTSVAALDASADYESRIQEALDDYAAHSDEILQRAMKEGNDGTAVDTVEIDAANGEILSSSSSSARLYADLGLKAVNEALGRIKKVNEHKSDAYDVYGEAFQQLTAQNDNANPTISYTQLETWEDVADIIHEFKDGELLSLWRKATGSEFQEGQMNLSQFVTFNNLLDKLLMAKVDFMTFTKGRKTGEGISFDQLWFMDALSDYISDEAFLELWQESTGRSNKKGFMSYDEFLVFHELAGSWLEHEYGMDGKSTTEQWENVMEEGDDSSDDEDDSGDYYHGLKASDYWTTDSNIADEGLPDDIKADLESDNEDIRIEAMVRRGLHPEMWRVFSYWQLHAYFACEKLFSSPRPLWTDQQWRDIRDFYHEFVEEDKKDEGGPKGLHSYQLSEDRYDLTQNAIPFQSGEKGRGLQAVRDIKAGELVFKGTNNTIVFNYGHTWRKLLFAVNERFADPGMTCDLLVWSWVQDLYDGGPLKVVMDLDSGSLLNEGRDGIPDWEAPNVQCGKPDATRCDMDYFASRDIKEGDEVLIDYREFAFLDSWPDMGL